VLIAVAAVAGDDVVVGVVQPTNDHPNR
jgi:hypothetical protein